jgi:hypothetical protein
MTRGREGFPATQKRLESDSDASFLSQQARHMAFVKHPYKLLWVKRHTSIRGSERVRG